ncbi:MAG TPA: hypothetical protein DDY91_10815 [Planctomycetaceae bacterium]|nr:hypothetical protein [Planctomycetaceae bacterium]
MSVPRASSLLSPVAWSVAWIALVSQAVIGPTASAAEPVALRKPWTTPHVQGTPEGPLPFHSPRIFPKALFKNPVVLTNAPGTDRLFVGEQSGKIFSLAGNRDSAEPELFLDTTQLCDRLNAKSGSQLEFEALYGLTFHPQFAANRECFACYVVRRKNQGTEQTEEGTRVVRLKVSSTNPPVADPASEELLVTWLQGGHNGGCLKFGPDGCLYISSGDGGPAFPPDPLNAGQDLSNLLSSILRINVDRREGSRPYSIPADNPFVETPNARGEIWAYGLRNPWKMSFDRESGDLWVGDVGWELWELVYRVRKGDNFGWSIKEGPQLVHPERQPGPTPIVPPTVAIPHTEGASVTGGFVYRGKKFPELTGQYVFGDWESRRIWAVEQTGSNAGQKREIAEPSVRVVDFSEDNNGELYLLDYDSGTIHELTRTEKQANETPFPQKLSETGLFAEVPRHQLQSGVIPFSINAPRWADGATSERFIAVPGSDPVQLFPGPQPIPASMFQRTTVFPTNTVVAKTLALELEPGVPSSSRRIETQILHFDGRDWRGYSYAWNDDQSDAVLVGPQGESRTLSLVDPEAPNGHRQQTWRFPSRTDCLRCHNPWPEYLLAFNLPQLNRSVESQGTRRNQLTLLQELGLLQNVTPGANPGQDPPRVTGIKDPEEFPRFVNPHDRSEDLDQRARTYLHVNCAHCHRNGGGGSAYVHLLHDLPLSETRTLAQKPAQGTFGIPDAQVIAPADPYRSTLLFRMAKLGPGHMPHIGSQVIDREGVQLIHDWIRQLPQRSADQVALDRLVSLDEPRAASRERRERPFRLRQVARQIAVAAGRPTANDADLEQARQQLAQQASEAQANREKLRPQAIQDLLSTTPRAFLLYRALSTPDLSPQTRSEVLAVAAQHADPATRDLYESLLPEELRTRRLGDVVSLNELLNLKGDPLRGRELFQKSTTILCRNCHRIGDQGVELGPDLSVIGKKYTRAQILENILEPSRTIEPRYLTYVVETKAGKLHSGLLTQRTAEEIVLRDVENKEHRIPAAEIESVTPQQKSIMPELLLKEMTPEQVADLLEYLSGLK